MIIYGKMTWYIKCLDGGYIYDKKTILQFNKPIRENKILDKVFLPLL